MLLHRPGTSQAHQGPDGLSRNPPGTQGLVLARRRDWITFRSRIKGIDQALEEEDDEDKILPDLPSAALESFHEDIFDNWRRSADPRRSLAAEWTGRTECEAAGGNWIPYVHSEPRLELFVPPDEQTWTGRRHAVVKFVDEFPYGEPVSGSADPRQKTVTG